MNVDDSTNNDGRDNANGQVNLPFDVHPTSMFLLPTEIERALTIKGAVEAHSELQNLTDFDYAQYALATGDESIERVLQRVHTMQAFRTEYNIQETLEEGVGVFRECTLQHPGFFLAVEFLPSSGSFNVIKDLAAFFPNEQLRTPQQLRTFMAGLYYKYQCMSCTFQAIRVGISAVLECGGMGPQNVDFILQTRIVHEMFAYPKRHKQVMYVNSPAIVNIFHGLWKKYLTKNMIDAIHLGCQVPGMEGERIDILFKTPTAEIAREKMVGRVQCFLQVRYAHQKTFTLPRSTS